MTMSQVVPSRLEHWYPREVLLTRVGREEDLHAPGQVGPRCPHDQVEVIGQHNEGIQHPTGPPDSALQARHQPLAIVIVRDDVLPAVTPGHDMVDGVVILNPESSCHSLIESARSNLHNKKILTRSDPEVPGLTPRFPGLTPRFPV